MDNNGKDTITQIVWPGIRIAYTDRDIAFKEQNILSSICDALCEAFVSAKEFTKLYKKWIKKLHNIQKNKLCNIKMQIFAKSFVYSLDTIGKQLGKLSISSGEKDERIALCELYCKEFKDFKYIRDSSMHIEDRVLGLDRKLKSINTNVLVIGGFINNCYSYSGSDGKPYQIEVSMTIAKKAGKIIQKIINTYVWEK